jgi:hypothetical protein
MHLHRVVPLLATVVTLAGASAPAAYGFKAGPAIGGGGQPSTLAQHQATGTGEWLAGFGTAGGLAVFGTGCAAILRRRRAPTSGARAASLKPRVE